LVIKNTKENVETETIVYIIMEKNDAEQDDNNNNTDICLIDLHLTLYEYDLGK